MQAPDIDARIDVDLRTHTIGRHHATSALLGEYGDLMAGRQPCRRSTRGADLMPRQLLVRPSKQAKKRYPSIYLPG